MIEFILGILVCFLGYLTVNEAENTETEHSFIRLVCVGSLTFVLGIALALMGVLL